MVIAYGHPPQDVTANAYEKGLGYNDTLERSAVQAQLGWTSQTRYDGGTLVFELRDGRGRPIEKARVKAWFVHPGQTALDRSFDLHGGDKGVYITEAPLPAAGNWTVHVTAEVLDRQYQATTQVEVD
ncbi:MAG: FixH family protein [Asticcacaulis sp.]|nr:FixH family protein [Asticcacaulis sp.]